MNIKLKAGLTLEVKEALFNPFLKGVTMAATAENVICVALYDVFKKTPPYFYRIEFNFEKPAPTPELSPGKNAVFIDKEDGREIGIREVKIINQDAIDILNDAEQLGCKWVAEEREKLFQDKP